MEFRGRLRSGIPSIFMPTVPARSTQNRSFLFGKEKFRRKSLSNPRLPHLLFWWDEIYWVRIGPSRRLPIRVTPHVGNEFGPCFSDAVSKMLLHKLRF
jgi:hypothetical protein